MSVAWRTMLRPALVGLEAHDPAPGLEDLQAQYGRDDFVELHLNEDQFGQPPEVLAAAASALEGVARYPDDGRSGFRAVLAASLSLPADAVVPAHGAQALIFAVASSFLDRDATAVVPGATYGLYAKACAATGATVVRVPNRGLEIDLDGLARAAHETGARLAWVCSPNNPTGLTIDDDRWEKFISSLPAECLVVVDEAYVDFASTDPARHIRDVVTGRPVIVLRTFSKIFGMAGLRLGYAIADPEVCRALDAVQGPFGVNRVALAAGRAAVALTGFVEHRRAEVAAVRESFAREVAAAGMTAVPSEANFMLVDVAVGDVEFADALARRGILVRPGADWGLDGYVRVTMAPEAVMRRVANEMTRLRGELLGPGTGDAGVTAAG